MNLHPEETEQPASSRALSWTNGTSLAGPRVQPKNSVGPVCGPHTDQWALWWVRLFASPDSWSSVLSSAPSPSLHPQTVTTCSDCSHKPSPLSPSFMFAFSGYWQTLVAAGLCLTPPPWLWHNWTPPWGNPLALYGALCLYSSGNQELQCFIHPKMYESKFRG